MSSLLLTEAGWALHKSQAKIGELLGVSRRTVVRWVSGEHKFSPAQAATLARAVYPVDTALAARIAAECGTSLEKLGLVAAPAPVAKEASEARLPRARLVQLVVLAAAEALDASPRAVRPALGAAFETARELGLDLDLLAEVLGKSAATSGEARPRERKGRR